MNSSALNISVWFPGFLQLFLNAEKKKLKENQNCLDLVFGLVRENLILSQELVARVRVVVLEVGDLPDL